MNLTLRQALRFGYHPRGFVIAHTAQVQRQGRIHCLGVLWEPQTQLVRHLTHQRSTSCLGVCCSEVKEEIQAQPESGDMSGNRRPNTSPTA